MARRSQFAIWKDTFCPTLNPRKKPSAGDADRFDDTSSQDLDAVLAANNACPETVWTLIDTDGKLSIAQGYHVVNRMGYYITEVAFDPTNEVHVRRYQQNDVAF